MTIAYDIHFLKDIKLIIVRLVMRTFKISQGNALDVLNALFVLPDSCWNLMDTAPKDRWVLLSLQAAHKNVVIATWYKPWSCWVETIPEDPENEDRYGIGSQVPNGWQELPEPKR
ncbi:MAG: hypothetical protein GWN00_01505 [Aliifodinibius sp.]|nr:hypothetical protein [Phycisphaerae bacterium]NIT54955.1 hypothetical protein [Fodinibius sp.]NIW97263.1 hypothetical protein [Phycisphaerae bacterium]NIY23539.1 hypothetical protein [Fodinibius sp.]